MLASAYDLKVLVRTTLASLLGAATFLAASSSASAPDASGIRGDIDGDGVRDLVSLTRRPHDFVLRVQTRRQPVILRVRGFSGVTASASALPRIVALRPLNRQPGLEIQVLVWAGASDDFLVFYTLHAGRLIPMTGGWRASSWPPYVWNVGGSLGTLATQADCIARHTIGVSGSYGDGKRWVLIGARYDVRATRFVRVATYRTESKQVSPTPPRGWPRVKRLEFQSCGGIALDPRAR